jgi:Spherulation-specific family 4
VRGGWSERLPRLPGRWRRQRGYRLAITAAALAATGAVATVIGIEASGPGTATSSACQSVVVPAYFSPGTDWARADESRPVPAVMILDITGVGAGTSPDRKFQAAVQRAKASGIEVMGYSATDYGRRPAPSVEADVRNYAAWYHVTDIFLDQSASGTSQLGYYRGLTDYIRGLHPGSTIMLNPGTYPDRRYMSIGDIVMVYENSYANLGNLQAPGWVRDYPAGRFAFAIYATPGSRLADALALSRKGHAGYVYVTDGEQPDPYSALPDYWSAEDSIIAAQCAG